MNRNEIFTRLRSAPLQITALTDDGKRRIMMASLQDGFIKGKSKNATLAQETGSSAYLNVYSLLDGGFRKINVNTIQKVQELNLSTFTPVRGGGRTRTAAPAQAAAKKTTARRATATRTTRKASTKR